MTSPLIIGFYGTSNSGKTTLLTTIIRRFTEKNYKVSSIKQTTHPYSIDSPGKDTWKHAEAGAELVCFQTAVETSFIVKKEVDIKKILKIIKSIGNFDIIFIEGARDDQIQKIRLDETTPIRKNTVFTFNGDINKVMLFIEQQLEQKVGK
jgi:molybdopterin-guanine dinucleotide biosynthesis adapter protein